MSYHILGSKGETLDTDRYRYTMNKECKMIRSR